MTDDDQSSAERSVPALMQSSMGEFSAAATRFLSQELRASLSDMVAEENRLRLHHGRSWGAKADGKQGSGELKVTSAEALLSFDAVLNNDLDAFAHYLRSILTGISSSMKTEMYAAVSAAATDIGNTVSQSEAGSFATAFLQMLKKVEFGVDARGEISMPQIHVPEGIGQKMLQELESQGPEYRAEVQRIQAEKSQLALAREVERLNKYKK